MYVLQLSFYFSWLHLKCIYTHINIRHSINFAIQGGHIYIRNKLSNISVVFLCVYVLMFYNDLNECLLK